MNILSDIVNRKINFWTGGGPRSDTVISTRVRLARNIPSQPFPHMMKREDLAGVESLVRGYLEASSLSSNLYYFYLPDCSSQERRLLLERNLISSEMENSPLAGIVFAPESNFSILVNDVDHLRIQVMLPGLQLHQALDLANGVDSDLNNSISYLFSPEYGFLGADPSENGTGMRVSAILHLPVVSGLGVLSDLTDSILASGFEISGTPGKGEMIFGGFFLLRSTQGFGESEFALAERAKGIVMNLVKLEDEARDSLFNDSPVDFEDRVMRSIGVLKFARKLTYGEAIEHLSEMRLGVVMSVIGGYSVDMINDLMVNAQWAHLQFHRGGAFSSVAESDEFRSEFIRERLKELERKDV